MTPTPPIQELRARLPDIMCADAAWCARKLDAAEKRLQQGQPSGRELQAVARRIQQSAERVERRTAQQPQPTYDDALPITAHHDDIVAAIRQHPVVVIAGETGSGKTTQLPKMCLDAGRGIRGLVGCTQPRRLAARAMAARVSEELGTAEGTTVGYQVRFRDRSSADGSIKFMTDGILLAESAGDRDLLAYDTIIIDEAHERSLNIDFLLGYLVQLLQRRDDLRVIITSATIDTEKFARHFGSAPVIEVSGRGYPVETRYRPLDDGAGNRDLNEAIADAVVELNRVDPRGDVLVFLSGEKEIREARDYLERQPWKHTEVVPLFARLSAAEQYRVFHPGSERRIVLATNVAETSLTVPRIRFVIDSGLARISRYHHVSRVQRLPIEPISQASANQRQGRCGRLGPGVCIRLFSEEDFASRPEFTEPEVLRTSLATVALRMLDSGLGRMEDFPFIDNPAPRMVRDAYRLLEELGAIENGRVLTPIGRQLARWPIDPRWARMVLAGRDEQCVEEMLVLAAAMSIQDPRERPLDAQQAADEAHAAFAVPGSDFLGWLKLWHWLRQQRKQQGGSAFRKALKRKFLNAQRVFEWFDLHQQLRDLAREERLPLQKAPGKEAPIHRALLTGLLSQVGRKDPEGPGYDGARARGFRVFPGSVMFGKPAPWVMAAEIVETTQTWARGVAKIDPAWIETLAAHLVKKRYDDPHFSRRTGRVMAYEQVSLFGLVVVERRPVAFAPMDPEQARGIFIREALVREQLDTKRFPGGVPFMQHNRELREQAAEAEHKRRRHDVLADEAQLEAFYDARLPAEVLDAPSLQKWLKGLSRRQAAQLEAGLDVLMRADAPEAGQEQFPDHLDVGGQPQPLAYRFEPGTEDDGVTLTLPLPRLNLLDAGRLQWSVPGLLEEKCIELIRTLPKPKRRALAPAPQFAAAAMAEMDLQDARPLDEVLAETLSRLAGVELSASDFDHEALPAHLRTRVAVTDDSGAVLASDRNVEALQERYADQARRAFMDRQAPEQHFDGETEWVFGDLETSVKTRGGVDAWPALVDQDDGVGLRLFDTAEEARQAHAEGVLRLHALTLQPRLKELSRHHGLSREAQAGWQPYGRVDELVDQLVMACVAELSHGLPVVRGRDAFEQAQQHIRQQIGPLYRDRSAQLGEVLQEAFALRRAINEGQGAWPGSLKRDIQSQLDDLIYDGFLADLAPGRLRHYPRYLKAILARLERARLDPATDQQRQEQLNPYWRRYLDHLEQGGFYDAALDRYRWLVEEFRVSLFAQELGTDGKVSPQRLDRAWAQVKAAG